MITSAQCSSIKIMIVVLEMLMQMKEGSIAQSLANKTTMISLFEACAINADLCTKLRVK